MDYKLQDPIHLEDYAVKEDKVQDLQPEAATEDQPLPWDAWDAFVEKYDERPCPLATAPGRQGQVF